MPCVVQLRFPRLSPRGITPPTSLDHIRSSVVQALRGQYGECSVTVEAIQVQRPDQLYLTLNVATPVDLNWQTVREFEAVVNGGVNSAGQGTWAIPTLLGGVQSLRRTTERRTNPGPAAAARRPLSRVRDAVRSARVVSNDPQRNGQTPTQADTLVHPDEEPGITLSSALPVLMAAGAIAGIIGAVVIVVRS